MDTVDIEVPVLEVVQQAPAVVEAPVFNAADLLFWPHAWATNDKDGETGFAYDAWRRTDRKNFKDPYLLHAHSTPEWHKRLKDGL